MVGMEDLGSERVEARKSRNMLQLLQMLLVLKLWRNL